MTAQGAIKVRMNTGKEKRTSTKRKIVTIQPVTMTDFDKLLKRQLKVAKKLYNFDILYFLVTFVAKTTILFFIQYAGLSPTENTHSNLLRMFQKQLKSCLLLAVALLFWGSAAIAQRQISGRVTDAETGEPLIGASIWLYRVQPPAQ
jgi:hypothetical protein